MVNERDGKMRENKALVLNCIILVCFVIISIILVKSNTDLEWFLTALKNDCKGIGDVRVNLIKESMTERGFVVFEAKYIYSMIGLLFLGVCDKIVSIYHIVKFKEEIRDEFEENRETNYMIRKGVEKR